MTLQVFKHSDGRVWLRKDGKIIAFVAQGAKVTTLDLATAHYKNITGATPKGKKKTDTISNAVIVLGEAMAKPILVTHPQFIAPYQYA